jgi:hypothetical protein
MSWEREFDRKYNVAESTDYWKGFANSIKQFIKDLRKKDEEELIKMFDGVEEYQKSIKDYYKE